MGRSILARAGRKNLQVSAMDGHYRLRIKGETAIETGNIVTVPREVFREG
jgi:hypothetical protein